MIDFRFYVRTPVQRLSDLLSKITKIIMVECRTQDVLLQDIAPLGQSGTRSLTYYSAKKHKEIAQKTKAAACFVTSDLKHDLPESTIPLVVDNPRVAFALSAGHLYAEKDHQDMDAKSRHTFGVAVHPTAIIGQGAQIGKNTTIGAQAYIGPGVIIGDNCYIAPGAVIEKATIGHHVTIKSGAVIGQKGFGFEQYKGQLVQIPHFGRVIVGSHVSIGSNTCIDRGMLEDTIVGDYVQIDNLVQIAHNVHLGPGVILVSQVGIAGSTQIGAGTIVAGQVGLAVHLTIGKKVKIAAQSGVIRDIPDGQTIGGSPAVPIREWHRQVLFLSKNIKK